MNPCVESPARSGFFHAPWHERVVSALSDPPGVLYHATTPKKVARYIASGAILPPVRGFDTEEAAREWGRLVGRSVFLKLDLTGLRVQALPDHHQGQGLAWWTPQRVERFTELPNPCRDGGRVNFTMRKVSMP